MREKHGSEEAVREFQRANSAKSKRNTAGTGGFKHMKETDPARLKAISKLGVAKRHAKQNTSTGQDSNQAE